MKLMLDQYRIKKILEKPAQKIFTKIATSNLLDVNTFLHKLYTFLTSLEYKELRDKKVFILSVSSDIKESTSEKLFDKLINMLPKYNYFQIDFKENIDIYQNLNINTLDDIQDYSEDFPELIFFYIEGFSIEIINEGVFLKIYNNVNDMKREGRNKNKYSLPVSDYRILTKNHFEEHIINEKKLVYWDNKSKRLLKKSPENIFHKSLYAYLDINLANGRVDCELSNKGGNDRLDIQLVSFDTEEVYILEIKWMGKSCTTTSYSKTDMENAFGQLNIYLENNSDACKGALVIYDASLKDEKIICKLSKPSYKLDIEPIKLFLVSEPASVVAKKPSIE